jgi:hypothetical protein
VTGGAGQLRVCVLACEVNGEDSINTRKNQNKTKNKTTRAEIATPETPPPTPQHATITFSLRVKAVYQAMQCPVTHGLGVRQVNVENKNKTRKSHTHSNRHSNAHNCGLVGRGQQGFPSSRPPPHHLDCIVIMDGLVQTWSPYLLKSSLPRWCECGGVGLPHLSL